MKVGRLWTGFGEDWDRMAAIFSKDVMAKLNGRKIGEAKLNDSFLLVVWRAPEIELFDEIKDERLCTVVSFSCFDAGSNHGEGFAVINTDETYYKFVRGDIMTPNRLYFRKKEHKEDTNGRN